MPLFQLHCSYKTLAVVSSAGPDLEDIWAFFQEVRGVVAVTSANEAKVLAENGVPGGEFGGPGDDDELVFTFPVEVIDHV